MTAAVALAVAIAVAVYFIWREFRDAPEIPDDPRDNGPDGTGGLGWHILGPTVNGKVVQRNVTLDRSKSVWSVEFDPDSLLHAVVNRGNGLPAMPVVLEVEGEFTKQDGSPAFVHLYVQRKGDDWSARGGKENYRFYSPLVPLEAGRIVLDYPLEGWTNVRGKPNEAEFQNTLRNIDNWGVRFGPHGVRGGNKITLIRQ